MNGPFFTQHRMSPVSQFPMAQPHPHSHSQQPPTHLPTPIVLTEPVSITAPLPAGLDVLIPAIVRLPPLPAEWERPHGLMEMLLLAY